MARVMRFGSECCLVVLVLVLWGFEFVGARVLEFGSEWCLVVPVLVIDDFVG